MPATYEDWSLEQIATVRRLCRAGHSVEDAMAAIGSTVKREPFLRKCRRLNIKFYPDRSTRWVAAKADAHG